MTNSNGWPASCQQHARNQIYCSLLHIYSRLFPSCFYIYIYIYACACIAFCISLYEPTILSPVPILDCRQLVLLRYIESCGGWVCTNIPRPSGTRPLPTTSFVRNTTWGGWRCMNFSKCRILPKRLRLNTKMVKDEPGTKETAKLWRILSSSVFMLISFLLPLQKHKICFTIWLVQFHGNVRYPVIECHQWCFYVWKSTVESFQWVILTYSMIELILLKIPRSKALPIRLSNPGICSPWHVHSNWHGNNLLAQIWLTNG